MLHVGDGVQGAHALLEHVVEIDPELDEIRRARALVRDGVGCPEEIVFREFVREFFVVDALLFIYNIVSSFSIVVHFFKIISIIVLPQSRLGHLLPILVDRTCSNVQKGVFGT